MISSISPEVGLTSLNIGRSIIWVVCLMKNPPVSLWHLIQNRIGKLKFLWRMHKFLIPALKRLLCNALIQPHFDYASSAQYQNLHKKLSDKLQICQNKCIRFCLSSHIAISEFKEINWLRVKARFEQNVTTHIFKPQNNLAPKYMDVHL